MHKKFWIYFLIPTLLVGLESTSSLQAAQAPNPYFWDPFAEMDLYRRRINQIFEQFDSNFTGKHSYSPELSLEENEKSYLVKVDLPGLEKDSINVELKKNILNISGEREIREETENDQGFYRSERSYGAFHRSLALPDDIEEGGIEANYQNGVLMIKIARKEGAKTSTKKKIRHL